MNDLEFVGDYRQPHLSARQRALGHDGTSAGDFTFGDFLDIINPLQHIPLVSNIYRAITGDEIRPPARILGGTLFGGPTGFLSSVANTLYEEFAGEDVGETVIAFFSGAGGDGGEPQFAGNDAGQVPAAPAALETAAGQARPVPAASTASAPGGVLPEPAPGMLTGQAALDALFMDLTGGRQRGAPPLPDEAQALPPPRPAPVPAPPEPFASAPPVRTPQAAAPAHPLLFAQEAADGALADRMMEALDKYQAMARRRAGKEGEADARRRDARVPWQSDPAAVR